MSQNTAWMIVILSGLVEVVFAIALKLSEGFSRPMYGLLSIVAGVLSVWLMSLSLKVLPISLVYIVWSGIGALGVVLVGVLWLKEPISLMSVFCILAIIAGTLGLQLQGKN